MRKFLFSLFITVSVALNAEVVNDSILVEPEFEKGIPECLLADSIAEAPIAVSLYYDKGNYRFNMKLYELEHLLTNVKEQQMVLSVRNNSVLCLYDEIQLIIEALNKMHEYSQKPFIADESEFIHYSKKLSNGGQFLIVLEFDKKKDKWECAIGIANGDIPRYTLLNDNNNLLSIADDLKQMLFKYDYRVQIYKEPTFQKILQKDGSSISYFDENNSSILKMVVKEDANTKYLTEIIEQKHVAKINNILNKIIKTEIQEFKPIHSFGGIEAVIDENGNVVQAKLALNKKLTESLPNNTIGTMLKRIKAFKFIPISNVDRLNNIEYVNVYIPLSIENESNLVDVIASGKTEIAKGFKETTLKSEQSGKYTKFYFDSGDGLIEMANNTNVLPEYTEKLYQKLHIKTLNLGINNIIRKNYPNLRKLDNYGVADVVIGKSGVVIVSMISLNDEISKTLNNEDIIKLLNHIKNYQFEYFDEYDYPGVDFIKVFIPLKGKP